MLRLLLLLLLNVDLILGQFDYNYDCNQCSPGEKGDSGVGIPGQKGEKGDVGGSPWDCKQTCSCKCNTDQLDLLFQRLAELEVEVGILKEGKMSITTDEVGKQHPTTTAKSTTTRTTSTVDPSVDACLSNPCKHCGVCTSVHGIFTCKCPRGYRGRRCQTRDKTVGCEGLLPSANSLATAAGDCKKYCLCSATKCELKDCNGGLYWKDSDKWCDFKVNVCCPTDED